MGEVVPKQEDIEIHPLDEMSVSGVAALDEKISGVYAPEVWEQRAMYYIRRDPEGSFVAEAGGQVVGFMFGEVRSGEFGLEQPTGWIEVVGGDPDFREQAIGRRLAEAMLERFRERGVGRVCTLVSSRMEGLTKFFDALGFETSDLQSLSLDLKPGKDP